MITANASLRNIRAENAAVQYNAGQGQKVCECAPVRQLPGGEIGGRYIFFCPIGLVHWVSPIISGSVVRGALLGGSVLMMEPDELLVERSQSTEASIRKIQPDREVMVRDLPIISPSG